jgi:type I restriction enzyme S subunit
MMEYWKEVTLKDISLKITKGTTPTTLGYEFQSEGVNFIKAESVTREGTIEESTFAYIEQKAHESLKRSQISENDILLTIAGIYLGKVGLVKRRHLPANTNQAVAIIRLKNELCHPKYIKYFLLDKSTTTYLNQLCPQAAQPNLNLTQLGKLKFRLPHLETQKKIAGILSTYDDLIENNKRRIVLLEKMAEEIYREWFVRFRFPGYQTAEFEKGIPKGWTMIKLEKAFSYLGGGTPSKDNDAYWVGGNVNWYTPSDITGAAGLFLSKSEERPNEEGIARSSAKIFPAYSIMMTSRATIGAIGINRTEACTNQGFITCITNKVYPLAYLYHWLKLSKEYFISLCGGATFPELNKSTFKRIEILTPQKDIVTSFNCTVEPIFKQIEALLQANENLKATKNSLLPRLISGKLSVEDLDIQFPPSMQEDSAA